MKDNSGPAFPFISGIDDDETHYPGVSKRELFSAIVMNGLCAQLGNEAYPGDSAGYGTLDQWRQNKYQQEAAYCVRMADALLAELNKGKP
jgi:hypothetical protein